MSPPDSAGADDRGELPPPQRKSGTPAAPVLVVVLILLLLIAGGIGMAALLWVETEDATSHATPPEPEDFRLDFATLAKELADDREAAKTRHRGRMIEFEVNEITVESGDRTHVVLILETADKGNPASDFGIELKGRFPFANPRNSILKEARSGPIRLRVRGTLARIEHTDAAAIGHTVILDPAWVGRIE